MKLWSCALFTVASLLSLTACEGNSSPSAVLATAGDAIERGDLPALRSTLTGSALATYGNEAGLKELRYQRRNYAFKLGGIRRVEGRDEAYRANVLAALSGSSRFHPFEQALIECHFTMGGTQKDRKKIRQCAIAGISEIPSQEALEEIEPGRQTLTLLTSFDPEQGSYAFLNFRARRYLDEMDEMFRAFADAHGYVAIVKHYANQYDIWNTLRSPGNVGLIWASHAAYLANAAPGMQSKAIKDSDGFDVTSAFLSPNAATQFISIVGCHSEQNMQGSLRAGLARQSSAPQLITFDQTVDAREGLKRTFEEIRFKTPAENSSASAATPNLSITRVLPDTGGKVFPALLIEADGKILGALPSGRAGEIQTLNVAVSPSTQKIKLDAGSNTSVSLTDIEMGELRLSEGWQPLSVQGKPLGITLRVFTKL